MPPMIDWGSGTTAAPTTPAAAPYQPPKPPQENKYPNIPKGTVLNVKVVPGGVAIEQLKYANKKNPEITTKVSFHFVVTDGEWEKRHIWGSAQPTFDDGPQCYLRLWLQALLGVDEWPEGYAPAETTEVNKRGETIRVMHDFDNLPAKVLVGAWTTNDGVERFGVDDVTPIGAQDAAELY